jgi:hypothetical protein
MILLLFPFKKTFGWVLVNLSKEVVQLLQLILNCLKAKGKGGTSG